MRGTRAGLSIRRTFRQVNSKRARVSTEGTLNAGPEATKLLGANPARELSDILTHSYRFSEPAPPAKETRMRTKRAGCIEFRILLSKGPPTTTVDVLRSGRR